MCCHWQWHPALLKQHEMSMSIQRRDHDGNSCAVLAESAGAQLLAPPACSSVTLALTSHTHQARSVVAALVSSVQQHEAAPWPSLIQCHASGACTASSRRTAAPQVLQQWRRPRSHHGCQRRRCQRSGGGIAALAEHKHTRGHKHHAAHYHHAKRLGQPLHHVRATVTRRTGGSQQD